MSFGDTWFENAMFVAMRELDYICDDDSCFCLSGVAALKLTEAVTE